MRGAVVGGWLLGRGRKSCARIGHCGRDSFRLGLDRMRAVEGSVGVGMVASLCWHLVVLYVYST